MDDIITGNPIVDYQRAEAAVFQYFQVPGNIYLKVLDTHSWSIEEEEDFCVLNYWEQGKPPQKAVIVRKNELPMVIRKDAYTFVTAIECVKVGFILSNSLEQ